METFIFLGLARVAVLTLPFRWVASVIGEQSSDITIDDEIDNLPPMTVKRVARAIRKVSRYTPWQSNCLAKAIAGQFMLRRRRIGSTLYFGLLKDNEGEFMAHAWLRSGGTILSGGGELDRYTIVGKFIN